MNLEQAQKSLYSAFIIEWLLLAAWELLLGGRVAWRLSAVELGSWTCFFLALPMLAMLGLRYRRKWAGWLTMVYGLLLVILVSSLAWAVLRQSALPDEALLVLAPLAVLGAHLFSNGKILHQLLVAAANPAKANAAISFVGSVMAKEPAAEGQEALSPANSAGNAALKP